MAVQDYGTAGKKQCATDFPNPPQETYLCKVGGSRRSSAGSTTSTGVPGRGSILIHAGNLAGMWLLAIYLIPHGCIPPV